MVCVVVCRAYCLLFEGRCLLFVACNVLFGVVCCVLVTACRLSCLLFVVWCLLCAVLCLLFWSCVLCIVDVCWLVVANDCCFGVGCGLMLVVC